MLLKCTFKILSHVASVLVFLATVIPVFGTTVLFEDDFSGSQLNPLWIASLPSAPVARGDYSPETYLGASHYQFQTLGSVPVLRMSNALSNLQRVGWSLNTSFPASNFRYEVRFNTLIQSASTSVDAFIEVWILNATNSSRYDLVSLFGGSYGGAPEFDAASSISGFATGQSAAYQNNTYYRLVIRGGTNENIRASLCDDQGNELNGYDLGHTSSAYPAGFTIGISQAMDRPNSVYPSDVAIASAIVTTTNVFLPRQATGTAILNNPFVVGVNVTDGGYGYTNVPQVRFIGGGGSGAQAVAVVSNGVVTAVNVLNAGFGYTNAPQVVIDPPLIFNPVLAITPMSFLSFSNLTMAGGYQLQRKTGWYWTNQLASFTATNDVYTRMVAGVVGSSDYRLALSPAPAQAFATAQVVNGFVVGATVTAGGSGYVTSPTVAIKGGHGTNATAISHISGGVVTGISITGAGINYDNSVTVQIAAPPAAAVSPAVQPVMRMDASRLAAYANYQVQFKAAVDKAWSDCGPLIPTDTTNSQYLFITNNVGFFRLVYQP